MKILADKNGIYQSHVVILGSWPQSFQWESMGEHYLIDDIDILVGECSKLTFEQIADKFCAFEKGLFITRNPLVLNYFTDEFATKSFAIYDKILDSYVPFFTKSNIWKLAAMGAGEVVADSIEL